MKLAIGTAQFGANYGISNNSGQINSIDAEDILKFATSCKIDTIDTAIAYGESEKILGEIGVENFRVVTKLPEIPCNYGILQKWVDLKVDSSLMNLRVKILSGLLLHRPEQLLDKDKKDLCSILTNLKSRGKVKKIGFSIYNPEELDLLLEVLKPDIVQVPYNILDRRLDTSGWLQRLFEEDIEIHIRSIFLQGLLLMNSDSRPDKFNKWQSIWNQWDRWLDKYDLDPVQVALSFALFDSRISRVIVGIDDLEQLKEIVSTAKKSSEFPDAFYIKDKRLIDPSKWESL